MEDNITHTGTKSVRWKRKIRRLTNENIINLPKQIEFFTPGDNVSISVDGQRLIIEKVVECPAN